MRILLNIASQVVLAAVALIVVHLTVKGATLHVAGFFAALAVFTLAQAFFRPIVTKLIENYAESVVGLVGLGSTLLSLFLASLFKGGIVLSTVSAWVLAPLIVWAITGIGGWAINKFYIEGVIKQRELAKGLAKEAAKAAK